MLSAWLISRRSFEDSFLAQTLATPDLQGDSGSFMTLIRSFSDYAELYPTGADVHSTYHQPTRHLLRQVLWHFYKAIVSRVVPSISNPNANTLTLKMAAAFAESGELRDVTAELLKANNSGSAGSDLMAKEVQLLLTATKAAPISSYDIISDPKSVNQLSLLYNSMQWLSAALAQLRHVDNSTKKSHSRNTSKSQNTRRWTVAAHLKSPNAAHAPPLIFLPLDTETVVPFDTTLTSFRTLAETSLLTLHLDIRCGVIHQLSRILRGPELLQPPGIASNQGADTTLLPSLQRVDSSALPPISSNAYPFVLSTPPSSASSLILQLNSDLIAFESNVSSYLGIRQRRFILAGLPRLVDKLMVTGADNVLVMNTNGAEKMRVDALVVQQNLRGLLASVASASFPGQTPTPANGLGVSSAEPLQNDDNVLLTLTQQYYTLFLSGPDEIIRFIKDAKSAGRNVGYTYDELRTLIELCYSEKLRGEDREESVKARKKMGEVLLSLGEGMWDS